MVNYRHSEGVVLIRRCNMQVDCNEKVLVPGTRNAEVEVVIGRVGCVHYMEYDTEVLV